MALFVKVRHTFGHRWMPFFVPVAASILYVLMVTLLIPERFSAKSKETDSDKAESPVSSSGRPEDGIGKVGAPKRPRMGARGAPAGAIGAPGAARPIPPPAAPQPAAASPDGAD